MKVSDFIARSRSAAGKKIKYKLGAGGMSPSAALPANLDHACDCSGYVCWALGMSRKTDHGLYVQFNNGWINTDAMVHDAKKPTGFFEIIAKPKVGALVVYPSGGKTKVGHVGIVTAVDAAGKATKVLHCSSGNWKTGDAIQETALTVFQRPDAIYAWAAGLTT